MEDTASTDPYFILWALLIRARDTIAKVRQKELRPYRLTPRKAAVLFYIQAIGDQATPAEISRWSNREPHSTSNLLGRMEREGLIKMVKDLDRKNMIRVTLTEKGRQAYSQSIKRVSIHKIMSALSEEQRRQLGFYLQILWDTALKELGREHKAPFPPRQSLTD